MASNIAVLHYATKSPEKVRTLALAFAHGLQMQNLSVDLMDGDTEIISGMARYPVIALIADTNFWGRMPGKLDTFFLRAGMLNGIKCYVYMAKQPVGGKYALNDLIKLVEEHGMKVRNFGLLQSEKAAQNAGLSCRIE